MSYFTPAQKVLPRYLGSLLLLVFTLSCVAGASAAQDSAADISQSNIEAEVESLNWRKGPGEFFLDRSKSVVRLGESAELLIGVDVGRYLFLTNGIELPEAEAVLYSPAFGIVLVEYSEIGYVKTLDWEKINIDDLLDKMKVNLATQNKERIKNGHQSVEILGWQAAPSYDGILQTVEWSLSLFSSDLGEYSQAGAVKLGRHGIVGFSYVDNQGSRVSSDEVIQNVLSVHDFQSGAKYSDYIDGDKIAGATLAGLIAAKAGLKTAGKGGIAVLLAAIALFLKKGGATILAALAGLAVWKLRSRKKDADSEER